MMTKLMPKSLFLHTFSAKAKMHETIVFTIENVVLGIQKCLQNRYKIDARKCHAKSMGKYAKMDPKLRPKSIEKLKIFEKNIQNYSQKNI